MTEKFIYATGETVVISGSGFSKFEQVTINIEQIEAFRKTNDLMANWIVFADQNGSISGEWRVPFEGKFVIKATGVTGLESQTVIASSVTPIVLAGNPSCATLNASSNPAFAHITSDFGLKLDSNPSTGNYSFTNGGIRELTGGAPAEPGNSVTYTRISDSSFDWAATRSISAVIVKAATQANVYPYNPLAFNDQGLVTVTGQDISHVEFCYGPSPASITIIKDAQPSSTQSFDFTATGQVNQNFSLVDNGVIGPDRIQFMNLTGFGAAHSVTVTEGASAPFSLIRITCTSNGSGAENNSINAQARFATIQLEPGENVVCTFLNAVVTAAHVSVTGQVTDAFGAPLSRATVMIQNLSTGEIQSVSTNSFGNYRFAGLASGESYIVNVSHRKYTFSNSSQILALNDAVENMNFTADLE